MSGAGGRALSLRARLVLGILALLALVVVVIGVASGVALRGFLIGQLDAKLSEAAARTAHSIDGGPGPGGYKIPPQGPGTIAVVVGAEGSALSGRLDQEGATVPLTEQQLAPLTALVAEVEAMAGDAGDAGPQAAVAVARSLDLDALGSYRVVVVPLRSGAVLIGLPLADVEKTVASLWLISALVGAAALAGAAALGALVVRLALRPLDRVVATAGEVSRLPLDRDAALAVRVPDADERTEVGRVGASINRMLDHVGDALESREEGERRLRRFVADASHELRTPLASIRGYAELTRRSGQDVPQPVAHALGRIESESVRMTGLVEDLLLLARLDEDRPLETAPVDLTDLLVTAVSDIQVASPGHEWAVEVPEEPVTVEGDAARLHQVAVNLLGNAGRHTPAGTSVVGRIRVEGGAAETLSKAAADGAAPSGAGRWVVLEVEDDGPGIAPELLPSVFGRFVRGDASRARATGSTGLGLAIVHAVALAHGGEATAESAPGRTVFRVRLPSS